MSKLLLPLLLAAALARGAGAELSLAQGLKADWAFGPGAPLHANARFVARSGGVWVLARPNALVSSKGEGLALGVDALDLAQDAGGKLWLADAQAAGSLQISADRRTGGMQVALLLPSPAWRLAFSEEHGVLAYGPDPEDGRHKAIRLRDRRTLLSLPLRILALEATPQGLAVATPEGVGILGADGGFKPTRLPLAARSLAYVAGAGLVAATEDGAWLLRDGAKPLPILGAPGLRLRALGGALYALIPGQGGILRLRGLEDLKP